MNLDVWPMHGQIHYVMLGLVCVDYKLTRVEATYY